MLQKNAGYDPLKSYDPIAIVAATSNILVVHPSVPAKSVKELVAYTKANPGKTNFSSGGIGTLTHLIGEYFKAHAGIDVVHVPYRGGGPSIQDVVAGNIQYTFEGISVLLADPGRPPARARGHEPEAQCAPSRYPDHDRKRLCRFPIDELDRTSGAPGTPPDIIAKLNGAVNAALKTAEMKAALDKLAGDGLGGAPAELTKVIAADIGKWGPIVKALNLQTE